MGAEQPLGQAGSGISMYVSLPQGGGGKLTIDPDHVEVFINYMEQALDKLRAIEGMGQPQTAPTTIGGPEPDDQ